LIESAWPRLGSTDAQSRQPKRLLRLAENAYEKATAVLGDIPQLGPD
jgi:hypothetical protein